MPQTPTSSLPRSMRSASSIRRSSTRRCSRSSKAARLRGQIPGGHTKNLFLRDKKHALFLVVAEEDAEIDLKGLHRLLGASGRFSFGSSDLLREVLGRGARRGDAVRRHQRHGKAASRVVLDAAMMEHETLNYHPLVNTMTTSIARDDLVKFLESTGHLPRIERVSGPSAGRLLTRLHSRAG